MVAIHHRGFGHIAVRLGVDFLLGQFEQATQIMAVALHQQWIGQHFAQRRRPGHGHPHAHAIVV